MYTYIKKVFATYDILLPLTCVQIVVLCGDIHLYTCRNVYMHVQIYCIYRDTYVYDYTDVVIGVMCTRAYLYIYRDVYMYAQICL